jgi:hypothetical protein
MKFVDYLKWVCVALLILAIMSRSIPGMQIYDIFLSTFATIAWLISSILTKDKPFIFLNVFLLIVLGFGIYNHLN